MARYMGPSNGMEPLIIFVPYPFLPFDPAKIRAIRIAYGPD